MRKARKLSYMVMGLFLAMPLAACGNAVQDKAEDVSGTERPPESADAGPGRKSL